MQNINLNPSLKSYLDMSQLLQIYRGSHEENRSFALGEKKLQKAPVKLLLKWLSVNSYKITTELNSKKYLEYLSSFSSILGLLAFIMGFIVGVGLLSYSGQEPVNIIYYLLIAVILPIFSIIISLLSTIAHGKLANFLTLLFPLHWIEKLFSHFPIGKKISNLKISLPFELSKLLFLERLQLFSLIFSIGLFLSLIVMVIATDIAFGWSSTLQISSDSFHTILSYIGILWAKIVPSAIPSIELVDMSHYFRLGERLDNEMVHNADKLGAWWKFLAMSTLVYAIGLRLTFWIFVKNLLENQIEKEFLRLEGINRILMEFQRPFVSTQSAQPEKHLEIVETLKEKTITKDKDKYSVILGWNYSFDEMQLANDNINILSKESHIVGGSNSFTQDKDIVKNLKGKVAIYVKSWEPPTWDFIDLLEILVDNKKIDRVEVYPLGTADKYYKNNPRDIFIWERKIEKLQSNKVWVIDNE
ncbi:MAG: DUF2868 domain-containing protein [Sulfurovaceae bacterium]|nr:DUF2868 domain-containing protein [Sulfurovaceae bacterium]